VNEQGGEVSRSLVLWAAARTVDMHRSGECARCRADGSCPNLRWVSREYAAETGSAGEVVRR